MDAQPLASFVDPSLEARPLSDQRLVRDLDGTLVDDDQARGRQRPDDRRGAIATEFVECGTTTCVHRLAWFDEPEEHRAGQLLVGRVEFIQHAVCCRRDRAAYPSGLVVALEGEPATVPSFPGRMQRVCEQWKGTGFPSTSATSTSTSPTSTRNPAVRAGSVTARRSSSADIGPSST